jgi:hypothetical protein
MSGSSFFGFLDNIAGKNKELMEINDNGREFISNLKKTKESYEKLMLPYKKMEKDMISFTEAVTTLQNEKACSILSEPKESNSGFFSLFSSTSKPKEEENVSVQEPIAPVLAPSPFGQETPAQFGTTNEPSEEEMPTPSPFGTTNEPSEEEMPAPSPFGTTNEPSEEEMPAPSPFGQETPAQFGTTNEPQGEEIPTPSPFGTTNEPSEEEMPAPSPFGQETPAQFGTTNEPSLFGTEPPQIIEPQQLPTDTFQEESLNEEGKEEGKEEEKKANDQQQPLPFGGKKRKKTKRQMKKITRRKKNQKRTKRSKH